MKREIIIAILAAIIAVTAHHLFLLKKGYITRERVRGVYTIDLTAEMGRIAEEAREAINNGERFDIEKRLLVLKNQIELLAEKLPDGYLLLPEEAIIGGKRKLISLSTGKVEETRKVGRVINLDLLKSTQEK